jgi:hypothetical protein
LNKESDLTAKATGVVQMRILLFLRWLAMAAVVLGMYSVCHEVYRGQENKPTDFKVVARSLTEAIGPWRLTLIAALVWISSAIAGKYLADHTPKDQLIDDFG